MYDTDNFHYLRAEELPKNAKLQGITEWYFNSRQTLQNRNDIVE